MSSSDGSSEDAELSLIGACVLIFAVGVAVDLLGFTAFGWSWFHWVDLSILAPGMYLPVTVALPIYVLAMLPAIDVGVLGARDVSDASEEMDS